MKAIARKTKPVEPVALPLTWSATPAAGIYPQVHGAVVSEAEAGWLRATVEVDREWFSLRWTTDCGFRWRVFVNGLQAATDAASSVEFCQQQAEKFVRDWPKYPANAQAALLASEQPEVAALHKAIARIEGMAR